MSKDTRGYNVVRVIGLTGDEDLVDVRVSSNPVETEILELLSPCVTAANELKVKVTGDIVIGDVQVDNVQLVDDEGNELDFTASGAIQNYVNDGWDVAQGATTDTVTAPTVIGNLKALNAKDFATETTLATLGTESSLSAAALSLASIDSKDFASEATLTAAAASLDTIKTIDFATSAKQDSAKTVLDNIAAIDFATETTLTGAAAILTAIKDTDGIKKIVDKVAETVADGDNVALGTTTDADTALTVIGLLKALKAKDFATQTTLATLATEAKAEAIRALLETISGLDFAEETTQAAIETAIGATTDADTELTVIGRLKKILATLEAGITVTESAPLTSIAATVADGADVALGTTTDADTVTTVIGLLKKLQSILEAGIDVTESTPLTSIGATVADGDDVALGSTSDTDTATTVIGRLQKLITDLGTLADSKKLSDVITSLGYLTGISAAGAVGTLTATTTATAAIAGGSALSARKGLEILNNSANLVYWGYTDGVTTADGMPINPGVAKQFEFNPSVATAIYVIAGSDSELYIHEWK